MNKHFLLRALISGSVTLLVLGFTSALGVWQYSQSQRDDIRIQTLNRKPVTLTEIHAPEAFVQENVFARRVELTGALDCESSLSVSSATIKGTLCLFQNLDALPIVIFLPQAITIDTTDTLTLTGRLQPAQSYEPVSFKPLDDSLSEINIHQLVNYYKQSLYDGFVFVESIQSDVDQQSFNIDEGLLILPPAGIEFRNLFYAWQWWLFAGFALVLWVKYLRDEWRKYESTL